MGGVLHALKKSSDGYAGFGEAYFSQIHAGAIKDWRRHRRVTLNLVVPIGGVRFVVHDDRGESATQGDFEEYRVGIAIGNYARLTVAPGLWLAFQGLGPGTSLILDIIDDEHDQSESDTCPISAFRYEW
jgi:dTDP-4-dehydrorhamnose 3,5-epimerase